MINLTSLPEYPQLTRNMDEQQLLTCTQMWSSLWHRAANRLDSTTSSLYWMEKFGDAKAFNIAVIILKLYIKTTTISSRNWSEIQLHPDWLAGMDQDKLIAWRKAHKVGKYTPDAMLCVRDNLVRVKGKTVSTGLVRKGFAASANTQYYLDIGMLNKHLEAVTMEATKGIRKMEADLNLRLDEAGYRVISEEIVANLAQEAEIFTMGESYIDSRGRSIKSALSKVGNPIGFKAFRALITIPEV